MEKKQKEYWEAIHPRDTGGQIIYDWHCPYCVAGTHTEEKLIVEMY